MDINVNECIGFATQIISTTINGDYVSGRNVEQQELFEKQLFNNYMNLREFVFKEKISEEQREIVRDFQKIWNITVLNDLKPYYEVLSPEFFDWIIKVIR